MKNIIDLYALPEALDEKSKFKPFSKKNIQNRETARTIKQIFDKQGNIPDSNLMYAIEQEFYLNELSSDSKPPSTHKQATIFVLRLNKLISNFGNNWIKVLGWIFIFAFLVLLLHDYLPCWSECFTIKFECVKGLLSMQTLNRMIELINPINMFKNSNTLYQGHEFMGMIVRIITIYLFWQFTQAFRQNTKKK